MTVNGRRTLIISIVVVLALLTIGRGRLPFVSGVGSLPTEILFQLLMLWPIALIAAVVWFGFEVIGSLRRIESRLGSNDYSELMHGS